jgi:hypothetical protein
LIIIIIEAINNTAEAESINIMSIVLDFITFTCNIVFDHGEVKWSSINIPESYKTIRYSEQANIQSPVINYTISKHNIYKQYPAKKPKTSDENSFEDKMIYTIPVQNPFEILFEEQLDLRINDDKEVDDINYHSIYKNPDIEVTNYIPREVNQYNSKKYKKSFNNVIFDYEDSPLITKFNEVHFGDHSPKLLIIKNLTQNQINVYSNMYLCGTTIDEIKQSYEKQKKYYIDLQLCNKFNDDVLKPISLYSLWWKKHNLSGLIKLYYSSIKTIASSVLNLIKLMNDNVIL